MLIRLEDVGKVCFLGEEKVPALKEVTLGLRGPGIALCHGHRARPSDVRKGQVAEVRASEAQRYSRLR